MGNATDRPGAAAEPSVAELVKQLSARLGRISTR
jgi:hypothetical protein